MAVADLAAERGGELTDAVRCLDVDDDVGGTALARVRPDDQLHATNSLAVRVPALRGASESGQATGLSALRTLSSWFEMYAVIDFSAASQLVVAVVV